MKKKKIKLDQWQEQVLATKGHICLRSGRQVGKSFIISIKAAEYAVKHRNKVILVIAATERQAYLLFEKILSYLADNYVMKIKGGKDRPTKSKIQLTTGCVIYCLPTGLSGIGIRGYTVDLLIADEAAFIPEEVWTAVTPMLAVTKGSIILLSTPHGKQGYYYERFSDPNFTCFHISSEDCDRIDKIYLSYQRKTMTRVQYAQEYLGEFIDELRQFFPTALIKKAMVLDHGSTSFRLGTTFLGVDVARMGGDQNVLMSLERVNRKYLKQIDMEISTHELLTDSIRRILAADRKYDYRKIYIDDGGMGVGVFDPLLEDTQTKRKVVAINNASRSIDNEGRRKKLLKEDLYNNLLNLLERQKINLFNDPEIMLSLKSVQYEFTDSGNIRIFGKHTHIAEALVRAAWCMKDKSLNIYIY